MLKRISPQKASDPTVPTSAAAVGTSSQPLVAPQPPVAQQPPKQSDSDVATNPPIAIPTKSSSKK